MTSCVDLRRVFENCLNRTSRLQKVNLKELIVVGHACVVASLRDSKVRKYQRNMLKSYL